MKQQTKFKTLISKSTGDYGYIIQDQVFTSDVPFLLPITVTMSEIKDVSAIKELNNFTLKEIKIEVL